MEGIWAWARPVLGRSSFAAIWWTVVAGAVAIVVTPGALAGSIPPGAGVASVIFALFVVFWDLRPIVTPGGDDTGVTLSTAFVFAALLLWGFGAAVLLLVMGTVAGEIRRRKPVLSLLFNIAQFVVSYGAAMVVLQLGGVEVGAPSTLDVRALIVILLAASTYHLVNIALVSGLIATRSRRTFREEFLDDLGYYTVSTAAVVAVAPLLVVLVQVEPILVLLLLPPLLAVEKTAAMSRRSEYASHHDGLTALANRKGLERVVATDLGGAEPLDRAALVLLDLDRFKQVNDSLGHLTGDDLLVKVGNRLAGEVRAGDLVARLGGDEFAVWLPAVSPEVAEEIAGRLREGVRRAIRLESVTVDVDASIGMARYPDDGTRLPELLRSADVAMYAAKERGSGIEVYSNERDHNAMSRAELATELHRGIAAGELVLQYEPRVRFRDRAIVGIEAQVCWDHPTRGVLQPEDFLGLVEEVGLLRSITDTVVVEAVRQAAAWQRAGLGVPLVVPATRLDLLDAGFVDHLGRVLGEHGLRAHDLLLTIDEQALDDLLGAPTRLAGIQRLGIGLSIDGFGTGHRSLQHLRRMPVAELRVHQHFVQEGDDAPGIVAALVDLAHHLGLVAVAAGVASPSDWHALRAMGCDVAQGPLFSLPLPADEATACLEQGQLVVQEVVDGAPVSPSGA